MAGDGTLSNPRDGTVARWTPEGRWPRSGPIRSRELGPDPASRILVRLHDLRQQTAHPGHDFVRSAGSATALEAGRVIPKRFR
jgi:hypothetical protein